MNGGTSMNGASSIVGNYVINVGINPDLAMEDVIMAGKEMYTNESTLDTRDSAALTLHVIREYPEKAALHWNSTLKRRQQDANTKKQKVIFFLF